MFGNRFYGIRIIERKFPCMSCVAINNYNCILQLMVRIATQSFNFIKKNKNILCVYFAAVGSNRGKPQRFQYIIYLSSFEIFAACFKLIGTDIA